MKYYNLVLICICALILTSTMALKKSKVKNQKNQNKALMAAMTLTASKVLAKIFYDDYIKKELYKALFNEIIEDKSLSEEAENKITCRKIIDTASEKNPHLLQPSYFESFIETSDLEQDLAFRVRLFFEGQSDAQVKSCADQVLDKKDTKYKQKVNKLHEAIQNILAPLKEKVTNSAHELITSILSVHREFATKNLYRKLNHEE